MSNSMVIFFKAQSKDGGSRAGSRGGNSRSTPPSGAIRARIAAARLRARGLCTTASRRISRASSSMDRPLPAARTRNRVFTSSSRLRIVMLANGVPHRTAEALIYAAIALQSSATSSALDHRRSFCLSGERNRASSFAAGPSHELCLASRFAHRLQQLHRCWHVQLISTVTALVEALTKLFVYQHSIGNIWRRGRDSNPGCPLGHT